MAYRQYFPALSLSEGGRPYSIAEFATEKGERPIAYTTASAPDRDLELGQTRNRSQRQDIEGRWDGTDTDTEEDNPRPSQVKLQNTEHNYGTVPDQQESRSFEEDTEYRR
jgi:hypothetical protein